MNIISLYEAIINKGELEPDPRQAQAVQLLQKSWEQHFIAKKRQEKQGVYLWGGVGRGKTMIMDLFYTSIQTSRKQRWHFQEFMQFLHQQLHRLQGQINPVETLAKQLASEIEILCLDEFLVEDITDAMLLTAFIPALFKENVLFVTTANLAPEMLYLQGWQRANFLPTIHYLQKHLYVVHLDIPHDYRQQLYWQAQQTEPTCYIYPDNETSENFLLQRFEQLAKPPIETKFEFEINQQKFTALFYAENVLWCDFNEMCMKPRNSEDYLALSQRFQAIILSHVPILDEYHENAARRFMSLVDVCYDKHITLIISAATFITELYRGKLLGHAFQRTQSRLLEMQIIF